VLLGVRSPRAYPAQQHLATARYLSVATARVRLVPRGDNLRFRARIEARFHDARRDDASKHALGRESGKGLTAARLLTTMSPAGMLRRALRGKNRGGARDLRLNGAGPRVSARRCFSGGLWPGEAVEGRRLLTACRSAAVSTSR
jgi:hypothetical protein